MLDDEVEKVLRPSIFGIVEELGRSLEEDFERAVRLTPSNFGKGWEWREHGRMIEQADNKTKRRLVSTGR